MTIVTYWQVSQSFLSDYQLIFHFILVNLWLYIYMLEIFPHNSEVSVFNYAGRIIGTLKLNYLVCFVNQIKSIQSVVPILVLFKEDEFLFFPLKINYKLKALNYFRRFATPPVSCHYLSDPLFIPNPPHILLYFLFTSLGSEHCLTSAGSFHSFYAPKLSAFRRPSN